MGSPDSLPRSASLELAVPVRRMAVISAAITCLIISVGIVRDLLIYVADLGAAIGSNLRVLSLSQEQSLPTWWSVLLFLSTALILFVISRHERFTAGLYQRRWQVLAAVFLYLSLDELAGLHESVLFLMRKFHDFSGLLHFPWVIPASILVALLTFYMLPLLRSLPGRYRLWFVAAAVVFVGATLGLEMIGGYLRELHRLEGGIYSTLYGVTSVTEEALELIGLNIFFVAVLDYLASRTARVTFNITQMRFGEDI